MRSTFIKQSMGFSPLLTARDWLLFGAIVAVIVVLGLMLAPAVAGPFWRGAIIGGIAGNLPSLLACLPVHGSVAAEHGGSFTGRVEQAGFVADGETAEGSIYRHRGPRWLRWDSNRVVIRRGADGALQVSAPYYFYFRLKRMQG
ncbi:hypothetical protein [Duganella radicis]|uniref:Uncharacterized protein n=1 Tax=Duganella radicis TaxID=551988 RepID=A0A6L6PQG4_9BURK|nr:hypothetical protein [Duganella radicis]MTV41263.1 hypothetical protein [Duganella radicis]